MISIYIHTCIIYKYIYTYMYCIYIHIYSVHYNFFIIIFLNQIIKNNYNCDHLKVITESFSFDTTNTENYNWE